MARCDHKDGGVQEALRGLKGAVPDELLDPYGKLLSAGGCSREDAVALLGDASVVQALLDRGMAYVSPADPTAPPKLTATAPDLALHGALVDMEQRLLDSSRQFFEGHRKLREMRRAQDAVTPLAGQLVEVVTDRAEITELSFSLMNVARRDWMTLENLLLETPLDETHSCPPLPAFNGTVKCRSIYETTCLENQISAKFIASSMKQGEEARTLPQVGMKMKMADDTVAMLPMTPTGMGGVLIVRSPVIVKAIREYFEMLWQRAAPIGNEQARTAGPLGEMEAKVLQLLAEGCEDDAIARRLKVSSATVQRRFTAIRDALDVDTRFAAGVAAHRNGWVK